MSQTARLALVAILPLLLGACNMCGNEELRVALSPNGKRKAVMFERNCGVGSSSNEQVSIVEPDEHPEGYGNVVVMSDTGRTIQLGDDAVQMSWRDDSTLRITIHPLMYVGATPARVQGVRLEYAYLARLMPVGVDDTTMIMDSAVSAPRAKVPSESVQARRRLAPPP